MKPPVQPPPLRPGLQRNAFPSGFAAAAAAAPSQPQQNNNGDGTGTATTDSLSLLQLRRIVAEANRTEPVAYAFVYADMGAHAQEIDEWFVYQFWERVRLNEALKAFEWHWNHESDGGQQQQHAWEDADHDTRTRFVQAAIAGVQSNDAALRSASIGKLVYLVLGRWEDTAVPSAAAAERDGRGRRSVASVAQLQAIRAGVECLTLLEGLPVIWLALKSCFELHW